MIRQRERVTFLKRVTVMRNFGFTFEETGKLKLWQLDELLEILQDEEEARKKSLSSPAPSSGAPVRKIPVLR